MNEYYCFPTEQKANACVNVLNAQPYYPIRGKTLGRDADANKQKTEKWVDSPLEMVSGEWAVPRVPTASLDYVGTPELDRQGFLAVHGTDIRQLDGSAFVWEA